VIRSARPRRHGMLLLATATAALVAVLAGCEAGNGAPTLDFHPSTDSQTANAGQIAIRNVFVLGAPVGSTLHAGENASLFFSLINTGTSDRLLSITAGGSAKSVRLPNGGIAVNTDEPIYLSGPKTVVYLVDLTRALNSGSDLTLVLHFQKEGRVVVSGVPVLPRAVQYATFPPAPSSTTSAALTSATKHRHKAKASATPTPSVSPSPSTS
jgi:copper(I)-binding protein